MGDADDRGRHSGTVVAFSLSLSGLLLVASMSAVSAARPVRYILPFFQETKTNITAVEGSVAILPCSVENLGTKSVTWKKVTKVYPVTIGEFVFDPDKRYGIAREHDDQCVHYRADVENPCWNLRIRDVRFEHAGTYECQINVKEDFMRKVVLRVVEDKSPKGHVIKPGIKLNGTDYVEKGSSIDLNCTARAIYYRPKGVDWFKDGTRIKSGRRSLITEFIWSKTNVLHSRLQIDRAQMSDAGTYVCRFSQQDVDSIKVMVLDTNTINRRRGTELSQENPHSRPDLEEKVKDSSDLISPGYFTLLFCLAIYACLVSRHS